MNPQEDFRKLKFGMFIHYNMETYKDVQWGSRYHSPADFIPGGRVDTDAGALGSSRILHLRGAAVGGRKK